jgi:hypothetical protein
VGPVVAAPVAEPGSTVRRPFVLLALATSAVACSLTTEPSGPVTDVIGTWTLSGSQTSPAFAISGTLEVESQTRSTIVGVASWTEPDGMGGFTPRGGALNGRVIETTDVDFDVTVNGQERRHVGRISENQDTIEGVWLQSASGLSGTFKLVRTL